MPETPIFNTEQQQAITHGDGPLLIIAGAGTGKTTVITKRIEHLIIEKNVSPSNILALTFTEKAATEMETRIDQILPYGYSSMWIETFHAFCDRILRQEAIHIGLDPKFELMTEAEAMLFLRKHLFSFDLDYFRPLGNPMKFLQGMLQHFARLKDDDVTPTQYLEFAEKLQKQGADDEEIKKTFELAKAFKTYEDLKAKNGVMDFSDLIGNTLKLLRTRKSVLKKYQEMFQYILVDEFQDTNYAQNEMAILLAGEKQNITVVGDDDQCLPSDSLVMTPTGEKRIAEIKEGNTVLTGVGRGSIGTSRVSKVFKNTKEAMMITVTTASGNTLTLTDNHKIFCYVPKTRPEKFFFYVYLMHRKNLGWRLGVTSNLAMRLKLERSCDAIIGLRAFNGEEEARYYEILWSLTYQLPTGVFKERKGTVIKDGILQRLYKNIDTEKNARRLAADLNINLDYYHYVLNAVTRGQGQRSKIYIQQCYRNYAAKNTNGVLKYPLIQHMIQLETANQEVIDKLHNHGIHTTKAKKGVRVRVVSQDIQYLYKYAEQLAAITGGFIEVKSEIGKLNGVHMPSVVIPASNILEGLSLPIVKDNHIYYDEVVKVERTKKRETVYDLEIERTHNFIANGIVVHNSIYRWRGAALANMMQFRSHFPKATVVALTKNYRSVQNVLDSSYRMIQHNNPDRLEVKEGIDKKLKAMRNDQGEGPFFIYTNRVEEEAEQVAKIIQKEVKKNNRSFNDFAILVRANDHAIPFQRALERLSIPHQFLGPGHLFEQEEIKDLIAYLHVLANFEDTASLYRVLTMPVFALSSRDVAALLIYAKKNNCSLFEAMEQKEQTTLTEEGKAKVGRIVEMMKKHLEKISSETAGQILYYFFEDSGLLGHYLDPQSYKTERQADNIAKFFKKLQSFAANREDASVFAVVDWIDLSMELGESPMAAEVDWSEVNAVNILTVHSSKGLEFPVVFVVNLVSQRFPSRDRKESIPVPTDLIREELPEGEGNLAEERRLFYVAMTRAKDILYLTASRFYGEAKRPKKLSPFIQEALGEEYVKSIENSLSSKQESQQLSLLDIVNNSIQTTPKEEPTTNGSRKKSSLKLTYISYSQLQTFQMCPLHYKLRYLLNVPTQPSPALSYGISVHGALRDFYQLKKQDPSTPSDRIYDFLTTNWLKDGYTSKKHEEQSYTQARQMLFQFVQQENVVPGQILAIEQPFNFWLNNVKVGGRIDRIDKLPDGKIEIIDYKTGDNIPTERKLREDLQLTFYALAATEIKDQILQRDCEEIVLSLYYLDSNQKLSTSRTREDLTMAKETILEKVAEIEQSDFICTGSIFCKKCEFSLLCQTYNA